MIKELTSFARRALTIKATDSVNAGGPVEASSTLTVVDVLRAVFTGPAVDADAGVAADGVRACRSVVANAGPQRALVQVVFAELSGVRRRTDASVAVDVVCTSGAVLTQIAQTVVDVLLAVFASET